MTHTLLNFIFIYILCSTGKFLLNIIVMISTKGKIRLLITYRLVCAHRFFDKPILHVEVIKVQNPRVFNYDLSNRNLEKSNVRRFRGYFHSA